VIGCILLIIAVVDGFKVADSPAFICVELLLNVTISFDFCFRIRMVGFNNYMRNSIWNKLEVIIVVGCNLLFIVSMI
jgi:hypothetical protein